MACEIYRNHHDSSFKILKTLLDDLPYSFGHLKSLIEATILNIKFFKMPKDDGIEIIFEGLIFLVSFIVDPPKENTDVREYIQAQISAIINEMSSLICSIHFEKIEDQIISEAKFFYLLQKIDRVKAEVNHEYVQIQHSLEFNPPLTDAIGFLDSLLENLNKMSKDIAKFFPRVKHQVEKELVSLKPFLQNITKSKNKHKELKKFSTQIISIIYNADYVIKLCPLIDIPIWYSIICIYNVIQEIEFIKFNMKKIYIRKPTLEVRPSDVCPPQDTTKIGRNFIGFKRDAESIINSLTKGQKYLTIISISGLPGQGKTTLAKRIYNDPKIQFHFEKILWCYVSKEFVADRLLINIIYDVCGTSVDQTKTQDLIELLRKSLKGKKYLVILDDIWDVDAWRQIEQAFPDDKNKSRILFTSQNHNLALQVKSNSISYRLPLFSDDESWELIKAEVFCSNVCPPELLGIGKQIASYCKGLPLAVVLIAAVLRRLQKKLDLWMKVLENLKLHLSNEGYMNIIELSYEYLPEKLKPCFLYFSAFQRGEYVCTKTLKSLWIAEGFIKNNEMQCSNDLANEYLDNIISQNLVIEIEKNSMGGIKTCTIHDLLYDLCRMKAKEENIFHWADESLIVDQYYSNSKKYCHHRICIGTIDPFINSGPTCTRKELPTSRVHSFLWFYSNNCPALEFESIFWLVNNFKVLTILHLDGVYLNHTKSFEILLSMIHLRYLALHIKDRIVGIPPSLVNLWNLETLIVKTISFLECDYSVPIFLWKMKSLRHIDLPCARLLLENLEENNYFPTSSIERLGTISLKYNKKTMEFLQKLPKLRKFVCHLEMNEYNSEWTFMDGSLTQLDSLKIEGCDIEFLNPNKKIQIFNFLKIENLTKLTLRDLQLLWSDLSIIGKQLPNLQVLKLDFRACEGCIWNLKDSYFSKLKCLKLRYLDVEQIEVSECEENPFPCLEQLLILCCYKLKDIPSIFGDICTLMTITLDEFNENLRVSAEHILKSQWDMGNNQLQVHFATTMSLNALYAHGFVTNALREILSPSLLNGYS